MYGIYALVNLFSPNSLARCTRSFVLRKQINACVNTIRQHFPLRDLYILNKNAHAKSVIQTFYVKLLSHHPCYSKANVALKNRALTLRRR